MFKVKLVFLVLMIILAGVIFVTPMLFPEKKSNNNAKRIRVIVRIRMGCFLGFLLLMLLCVVL